MDKEKGNKVKGIFGTLLFHAVLLFLLSLPFMSLKYQDPPVEEEVGGSVNLNIIPNVKLKKEVINENKDILTAENEELIVQDEEVVVEEEEEEVVVVVEEEVEEEEVTEEEVVEEEVEYMKKNPNKITDKNIEDDSYEYGGEGEGKGAGEGKGFGDGLDWDNSYNSIDPATLDCEQGKGTGGLTIKIIRSPYGKIVEFDQTSFESTLTGFTFSSDQQKERLLDCIKKEYNEAIDKGEKVKIYEKDHLHTLKLDFIN